MPHLLLIKMRVNDMKKLSFLLILFLLIFNAACDNKKIENNKVSLTDAKIKLYEHKINQDPKNHSNYDNLAFYYFQKARETGNFEFYSPAGHAIKKSLEIRPDSHTGLILYAKLKLANHEFREALHYAKKSLEIKPDYVYSYGILGDAYLELHKTRMAENAYKKMLELNPSLDSYARMSNLMHHKHNHNDAIKFMELAYEAGLKKSSTPKEHLAWTHVMLGEIYLESGDKSLARSYFNRAIELFDGYYLANEHLKKISKLM